MKSIHIQASGTLHIPALRYPMLLHQEPAPATAMPHGGTLVSKLKTRCAFGRLFSMQKQLEHKVRLTQAFPRAAGHGHA